MNAKAWLFVLGMLALAVFLLYVSYQEFLLGHYARALRPFIPGVGIVGLFGYILLVRSKSKKKTTP